MNEFYHVSRNDISSIDTFELIDFDGHIEAENLYSSSEFRKHKQSLFPNGISKHGEIYLHNAFKSSGPNLKFTNNEFIIETTFELIRRLKFPQRNSRFLSAFACTSLKEARIIKSKTFGNKGEIYKVSCENYFKADMNLLKQGGSIIGIEIQAEKYWKGESTENPKWEILMEYPVKIIEKIE